MGLAVFAACQSAPASPPRTSATPPSAQAPALGPAGEQLLSMLPPVAQLPTGPDGILAELNEAADLLAMEPPVQPELRQSEDAADERSREKIEAYFESGLRWQDGLRLRAVELIGALMEHLAAGADPVLAPALAALVLEDLAALGFDATGSYHSASFDVPPERLAVAMASAEVVYSGLAAQLYGTCHRAALEAGAADWERFCAEGRHGMLAMAEDLPACTAPSISGAAQPNVLSAPEPSEPKRAGLLLQGAFGVPLLDDELSQVVAAVHSHLAARVALPLLPLSSAPATVVSPVSRTAPGGVAGGTPALTSGGASGAQAMSCTHPVRPSRAHVRAYPGTRWYGLFLECADQACTIGVCGEGVGGCQRATVQGDPTRVAAWQAAVAALAPAGGGLLLETSGEILTEQPRVALDDVRLFGTWRAPDRALQALSELSGELLECQSAERYSGRWVVDLGPDGSVAGLRAENDRFLLPMDQVLAADTPQRACIAERFRGMRLARAPRAATRRATLAMRIPARLQVDVPFTVRHDGRLGQLEGPERLGRDAFAVSLARCAARVGPQLTTMGLCLSLSPSGRIEGLTVDPNPNRRARVLARLTQPSAAASLADPGVQACISQALASFEWTCREPGSGAGHLAMTVDLPRGLVARFEE